MLTNYESRNHSAIERFEEIKLKHGEADNILLHNDRVISTMKSTSVVSELLNINDVLLEFNKMAIDNYDTIINNIETVSDAYMQLEQMLEGE